MAFSTYLITLICFSPSFAYRHVGEHHNFTVEGPGTINRMASSKIKYGDDGVVLSPWSSDTLENETIDEIETWEAGHEVTTTAEGPGMVLLFGGSTTLYSSGELAKKGMGLGFGQLLQGQWDAKIVCWGLSGYNALWARAALEQLIPDNNKYHPGLTERVTGQDLQRRVNLVVISFGSNDVNQACAEKARSKMPPGISPRLYAHHLRVMLDHLWSWNDDLPIALVGPPLISFYRHGVYNTDDSKKYNQQAFHVFRWFKEKGRPIVFVDLAGGIHDAFPESIVSLNMNLEVNSTDGIHLNADGNKKMATAISAAASLLDVRLRPRRGDALPYHCPELAGPGNIHPKEQIFKKWSTIGADEQVLL